jgi:hypothetical protein
MSRKEQGMSAARITGKPGPSAHVRTHFFIFHSFTVHCLSSLFTFHSSLASVYRSLPTLHCFCDLNHIGAKIPPFRGVLA